MKLSSLIFHPIKTTKRTIKKHGKKILAAYLMTLLPANVVSIVTTTPAQLTDPVRIYHYAEKAGVINFLTGGIALPAINGLTSGAGYILESIGDVTGLDSISNTGSEWYASGTEWFNGTGEYAEEAYESAKSGTNKVLNGAAGVGSQHSSVNPADHSPDYYKVVGQATIPSDCANEGIHYTGRIDSSGRIGNVCGTITSEMVAASAGHREAFAKGSDPAGWGHNGKVVIRDGNGKTYKGYMFNRSHLVADSLGGSATYENLVTGTRTQNVGFGKGGMVYTESKTRDFLKNNPSCAVKYSATPIYSSDEVVPRRVDVDVLSCDGSINEHVEVYNTALGYEINYNTGEYVEVK